MAKVAFFFQAEDGIRDIGVTGVQTCALPIFTAWIDGEPAEVSRLLTDSSERCAGWEVEERTPRSEERRVGKEGRSRGAPAKLKKKIEAGKKLSDGRYNYEHAKRPDHDDTTT